MSFTWSDLMPAMPEIFVLVAVSAILLIDLFVKDQNRFITYMLTQLTLLGAAIITVNTTYAGVAYLFNFMFISDAMASVLKLMSYIGISVLLVYSRDYLQARGLFRGEFFVLALFALLGMMVMISANHFIVLYIGLELLSLSLYAMVAMHRDNAVATEAAMKYFVLGALASGMLLYGMSMIYGATGSLQLNHISMMVAHVGMKDPVLVFGLVFIVAGLGFKLGVAPFHMWIPDVYQGAPTAVTLFIGAAPKVAAFAFVMRILVGGLEYLHADWSQMLAIMAVLSMAIGNITAIAQTNLKRMLAYSTISHMGFLLLGFLPGMAGGYTASMFYIIVYMLMSLGTFGMIMLMSRAGFECDKLDDLKGLNQRHPWYAFLMLLLMFSMAGVPPTVGFYAKLSVLQAAVAADYLWLAVSAVLLSVIGAFYYLRVVKLMYFDAPVHNNPITAQMDARLLMSINGLAVLALGLMPEPLMLLCSQAIQHSLHSL